MCEERFPTLRAARTVHLRAVGRNMQFKRRWANDFAVVIEHVHESQCDSEDLLACV